MILLALVLSAGFTSAQKLDIETHKMPISKKARKYGQYGGSYWDSSGEKLQTIYTYREKRRSPRSFDLVTITPDGEVTGPETELLRPENTAKLDLQIDETILEEDEFENFNGEMVWFKRVDLGWNAIAYEGRFTPVSGDFGFAGYRFEKESSKIKLMGDGNQALMLDFVMADGPIVEKYSGKVLLKRDIGGLATLATYAYVPKGDQVIVGGLMNGRVKIGMDASPDWLCTRYMVGTYDTGKMEWVEQNFIEFDYTMGVLASIKTDDGAAVLLRKDTKGVINNNRVRFPDSEYQGTVLLTFDKEGNLTSQIDFDKEAFNLANLRELTSLTPPKIEIRKLHESYLISAVNYAKGNKFGSWNIYKITDGEIAFSRTFTKDDLNAFDTPKGEKVKYLIKKREVPVLNWIFTTDDELLLCGEVEEIGNFIMRLDSEKGTTKQLAVSKYWVPKKNVNIPLGVRGWSKTKAKKGGEDYFDYPTTLQTNGDWYCVLYRKMNSGMTPGSTISSTSSYTYNHQYGSTTTTYTKKVKIDEVFAFGKLVMINKKTGAMTESLVIDDEILVGAYGFYVGKDGRLYLHGYDGKKYQMTTVSIK